MTTDDLLGFGAQRAIKELGYEDIAIVGFNNIPIAQYKNPPLASVDINSEKLGMYATKLLIDKLESRESKGYYVVETNLIERESLVKKDDVKLMQPIAQIKEKERKLSINLKFD